MCAVSEDLNNYVGKNMDLFVGIWIVIAILTDYIYRNVYVVTDGCVRKAIRTNLHIYIDSDIYVT